jgi:hypothetical protein
MPKLKEMVLTELFTGSKRSQSKKMVLSRVKCGKSPAGILVIGGTIAKRVSVSNTTKMVTNTKVCGPSIRNMVKVTTGGMKEAN